MELILDSNGTLCHIVTRLAQIEAGDFRLDVSAPAEFLQLGIISAPSGKSFRPHIHLERNVVHSDFLAQESWVVIQGEVKVTYFDKRGNLLGQQILSSGDISITYRGGHGYEIIQDSVIYEFKTGPYLGQITDKKFID
jgi:hypothetical protein